MSISEKQTLGYDGLVWQAERLKADIVSYDEIVESIRNGKEKSQVMARRNNTMAVLHKVNNSISEIDSFRENNPSITNLLTEAWVNVVKRKFNLQEADIDVLYTEVEKYVRNAEKALKK